MALLRSSYAPALPSLAHVAGRAVVRGAAAALAAAVVLPCLPLLGLLALLCAPPLLAVLLTVQIFSDPVVWLLKRVPLYRTLAARLHARTFEGIEPRLVERKRNMFASLSGDVVEVGAGAGLSFGQMPAAVTSLTAIEPHAALSRYAHASARAAGLQLRILEGDAEAMPLPDASADAIILTWQLCSTDDPARALREVARVLRPGGQMIFLEHMPALRAGNSAESRWPLGMRAAWPPLPLWAQQWVASPACKVLHGGCHLTRDAGQLVADACGSHADAPFDALKLSTFTVHATGWEWLEWLHAPHVAGTARKAGALASEQSVHADTPARAPGMVIRRAARVAAAAASGGSS